MNSTTVGLGRSQSNDFSLGLNLDLYVSAAELDVLRMGSEMYSIKSASTSVIRQAATGVSLPWRMLQCSPNTRKSHRGLTISNVCDANRKLLCGRCWVHQVVYRKCLKTWYLCLQVAGLGSPCKMSLSTWSTPTTTRSS